MLYSFAKYFKRWILLNDLKIIKSSVNGKEQKRKTI